MPERTPIKPSAVAPNPNLSPGIRLGDLVFTSGQVAMDSGGNLVGAGDCEAQSRQVMANVRAIVEAAGSSMQDVVKITCFLTDVKDYPAYSKVRSETWPHDPPASSTVMITELVRPDLLVEVEAIARVPGG